MNVHRGAAANLLWPVLLLGVAGDFLFRAEGLGINLAVWTSGVVAAWWLYRQRMGDLPAGVERALLVGVLALGAAFAWRENPMLRFLDAVALVLSFALLPVAAGAASAETLRELSLGRLIASLFGLLRRLLTGLVPTLLDANRVRREGPSSRVATVAAVARGTIVTVPLLLIFGGLLGHADPVFGDVLAGLVGFDPERLASHTIGLLAAGWIGSALLSGVLSGSAVPERLEWASLHLGFGPVEIGMILGLVDLLFAAFIAFQLPYLFGGAGWVERTAGVTLAEYARHGFFELVAVSGLVLPMLLLLHAQLPEEDRRGERLYRALAGWQILLVLVIMASAIHRMALYQREFGLTEDRFFASALIGGLAVTCCWFGATVLRGSANRFAGGALLAWAGWLALLHVVNPERVIVETNLARAKSGQVLDVDYLSRLTSDAVPALVEGLASMPESERGRVEHELREGPAPSVHDWRDWHFGRQRAERLIADLH